ncbi:hypothetical protein [Aneurinibacillus aneurinilyticus]|nr:hypothetical protein [Aneurinibacillus aneurinilyticus]MED0673688.1 hypothetical protein [Aneurinibacillus aneurinilyticus]MED0708817.1 hypothetical protein [Aneurinibacillus aneurinilyticus]MED0722859.1 hypothetical protein [Aneurinibacillus aneurinilyticus]MED0742884.1 hypothetical protein [Aneurinibacillus aneurinilyticus]
MLKEFFMLVAFDLFVFLIMLFIVFKLKASPNNRRLRMLLFFCLASQLVITGAFFFKLLK